MFTDLRALHQINPGLAREAVVNAVRDARGKMQGAAKLLGVSYRSLRRLMEKDRELSQQVDMLREELRQDGHKLRGYGAWHMDRAKKPG